MTKTAAKNAHAAKPTTTKAAGKPAAVGFAVPKTTDNKIVAFHTTNEVRVYFNHVLIRHLKDVAGGDVKSLATWHARQQAATLRNSGVEIRSITSF